VLSNSIIVHHSLSTACLQIMCLQSRPCTLGVEPCRMKRDARRCASTLPDRSRPWGFFSVWCSSQWPAVPPPASGAWPSSFSLNHNAVQSVGVVSAQGWPQQSNFILTRHLTMKLEHNSPPFWALSIPKAKHSISQAMPSFSHDDLG
jgi:hypothetical protein